MKINTTPFSALTDEEFVRHLLDKKVPTNEDVEAAIRLQHLLESYGSLLEDIHREAQDALYGAGGKSKHDALIHIQKLTAHA